MSYFVLLHNPHTQSDLPLVEEDGCMCAFESYEDACGAAQRTLFGSHGWYSVFNRSSDE